MGALAAKKPKAGSTLYVVEDPNKAAKSRLIKAVKGEGMPTHKNPFVCGNLFLILNIVFPTELDPAAVTALKKVLPPPKTQLKHKEGVDNHGKDAYDEDEERGGIPGGQRVQCNQQ